MQARLSSEIDVEGFREEARALLAHQVPPEEVIWQAAVAQNADQFAELPASGQRQRSTPRAASAIVPASFLRLCEIVVLHSDPQRFSLLYRLLWRLVHEPGLRSDPLDADMLLAHQMAQAVRRDMHKMKAFLRFHPVHEGPGDAGLIQVGWFDPTHHIVEAAAPWFARRYFETRWAILTPQRSVRWEPHAPDAAPDGAAPAEGEVRPGSGRLEYGPGSRVQAPRPDDDEALWLARYLAVFPQSPPAAGEQRPAAGEQPPAAGEPPAGERG